MKEKLFTKIGNLLKGKRIGNERASIIVSIFSMLIAGVSLYVSSIAIKQAHLTNELAIFNMIDNSKIIFEETDAPYKVLKNKVGLSYEEEINLSVLAQRRDSNIERYLNAYDIACWEYLNHKIDRKHFRETYELVLRQIRNTKELQDKLRDSGYRNINKVWEEWKIFEQ
jgi:hypothetical protein